MLSAPSSPLAPTADAALHPLDPLRPAEIVAAVAAVRAAQPDLVRLRFLDIHLHEPSKATLRAFRPGDPVKREAFLCLLDVAAGHSYAAVVDLANGTLRSWTQLADVQPPLAVEELHACEAAAKAHPQFQAALQRRGIDESHVVMSSLGAGNFGFADEAGRRLVLVIAFYKDDDDDFRNARLLAGLNVLVDANTLEVVRVDDPDPMPVPPPAIGYRQMAAAATRDDLRPLEITQPQGPSFQLEGRLLRWQKWRMRIGFTPREALVLHEVGYEDQGNLRSVLQRASVTELVVPYGDPTPAFFRRHPFDAGEFGLGLAANSLALGCDCLGEIRYLDAVVHNAAGAPTTIHNAICLHEEDVGVLWKHTEPDGTAHVRRSRRLVVSCFCTLGNYDYGFFWYFYQDGSIQFEAKLTGIVNTTAVPPGETSPYGTLMLPQVSAVHHQHFFNVRLDMAVDGERNSVVEVEARPEPLGPDNPYGNAFRAHETLLRTELAARRNAEPLRGRYWKVINPDVRNRMGQPVGYKLLPGENVLPLAHPTSSVGRRAGFLAHHLHVTPYAEDERYAPGDYPNQHPGGAGLPAWTGRDRVVEATDVVLWYTFGCTHIARLEEWPIMSVSTIGFMLKPVGFFDYNPAIDVPPPTAQHPACHSHCS